MATNKVKIGNVIQTKDKNSGETRFSIGLGNKSSNENYNLSVELTVKDNHGNVIARQTDGFVNLVDPRTQPDELLAAGIISQETAAKMRENASKISEKVKYQLVIPRS